MHDRTLQVSVTAVNVFRGWETFHARMDKSGRITIPKLVLKQLSSRRPEVSLTGAVMMIKLEPA